MTTGERYHLNERGEGRVELYDEANPRLRVDIFLGRKYGATELKAEINWVAYGSVVDPSMARDYAALLVRAAELAAILPGTVTSVAELVAKAEVRK